MIKDVRESVTEDQMIRENEFQGLPLGLYHHLIFSDGSRSVELSTPAHIISFDGFIDMGSYALLMMQDENMRKNLRSQYIKSMNEPIKQKQQEEDK